MLYHDFRGRIRCDSARNRLNRVHHRRVSHPRPDSRFILLLLSLLQGPCKGRRQGRSDRHKSILRRRECQSFTGRIDSVGRRAEQRSFARELQVDLVLTSGHCRWSTIFDITLPCCDSICRASYYLLGRFRSGQVRGIQIASEHQHIFSRKAS